MREWIRSEVNIHKTRNFLGADIGTDHDLVMMTFRVRLKKARKLTNPRLKFDLEYLTNPDVADTFKAINLREDDIHIDSLITTYNTTVASQQGRFLKRNVTCKSPESPEMFSTSEMRGGF
ncbi:MAG: hypothetical protein AB2693_27280 [Candidatus Thiodiazotropha sp.]